MSRTQHTPFVPARIAIVGAGLAGLTAGAKLVEQGHAVRLFDKGRGPGGRMSSRREPFVFDHGAQYFTVRDDRFQEHVAAWVDDGVAAPWHLRLGVATSGTVETKEPGVVRYVGVPRMSAITRHLATGLDVQTRTRVASLAREGDRWRLHADEQADLGIFDTVLLTLPPPQAADLLRGPAPALAERVEAVDMQPCWAVLVAFEQELPLPFDGIFVHASPVSWAARNVAKPERPDAECWVLHGSAAWSRRNLERPPEAICADIMAAFFEALGVDPVEPAYATAHRWRYALAQDPLEVGCFFEPELGLGVGGDWCHGSRVEGAFLSGTALAQAVLSRQAES